MLNKLINEKHEKYIFLIVLFGLSIIRLYHLNMPPIELEEGWRQADTESIASNFAKYKFSILSPNFNYDGPLPNVPALEFQVTTFVIAILYRLFGYNYLWARLVPAFFFMISAILLYKLMRKYTDFRGAIFSIFAYGTIPINIYYSRAVMPEAAGLMFFIGGLYYFECWLSSERDMFLIASSVFTALSLMSKPMTIFITVPMFYLLFKKYNLRWLLKKKLWLYAFFTLGFASAYYYVSISLADYKFTQGLARDVLFKRLPSTIFDTQSYIYIVKKLIPLLTPPGIFLAITGLFSLNRKQSVLLVWFGAMLVELILVVTSIRIFYYFIFFAVPCSILIGLGLARLYSILQTRAFACIVLIMFLLNSFYIVKPMYAINTAMENQVRVVREYTSDNDLLIVGSLDPCLLGLSGRRGWRFNIGIYPDIPKDDLEELKLYINNGAKYFIPIQGTIYMDENNRMKKYLDEHYQKIEAVAGYPIYKLQ